MSEAEADANAERGEHSLTLGKKSYVLRPSFSAIQRIEKDTGKALTQLVMLGGRGELTTEQIGVIGAAFIRAGAADDMTKRVNAEKIAELAYEEGLPHVTARLTLCLIDAATGGRTAEGEAKPVTESGEASVTGG